MGRAGSHRSACRGAYVVSSTKWHICYHFFLLIHSLLFFMNFIPDQLSGVSIHHVNT